MDKYGEEVLDTYNKIAEVYDKELSADTQYNNYIDTFLTYLKGKDILDVGCAMGSLSKYMADKGYNVDGIDFCPNFIKIAKTKYKNVNFELMDMTNLKLDKTYDGLMSINSVIHINKKNHLKLYKSFYKTLNPGGVLFLILQEGEGENVIEEPFNPFLKEYVCLFKENEIERLFDKANFKIIKKDKIIDTCGFAPVANQLVYYLKKCK